MSLPTVMIKKAAEILLSEGAASLLARSVNSLNVRIRSGVQDAAYSEIDRIAKSNISNSEKFSLIYRKKIWLKAVPHLNPEKTLSGHERGGLELRRRFRSGGSA
jgi:hypothetical protein